MLVLTRLPKNGKNEILIGDDITITICQVKGEQVRVGIDAPKHISITRPDANIKLENRGNK